MFVADPAARHLIVNWPQVAWAGLHRLRHQRDQTPFDETLAELTYPLDALADQFLRRTTAA